VWAAVIVALLLSLMFTRERMRLVVRLLAAAVVALLALEVFAPSTLSGIGHQLSAIWGATRGTAADASVKGHLSDISLGWKAVTASPLSGVGPHGQVLGLIVEGNSQLYIHNQILETWLRFGLFGAILVIAAQVVFVVQGLSVMRRTRTAFTTRWAAQLLVLAPVSLLTAPFLTNTQRWPAALGFAAGLAGTALAQNRSADVLDRPPA
jgi:O-antigen ligase